VPLLTSFYLPRSSPVHRLHPRVKIIGALAAFSAVMTFNDPWYQLGLFLAVLAVAGLARLTPADLLGRVRPVLVVALLIALSWAAFGPDGAPLGDWWIVHVTDTSLAYGLAVGLRVVTLTCAFFLLLETTEQADLLYGLISLRMPYAFAFIITAIFRFAPTIAGESEAIREAQRARAMDFGTGSIPVRVRKQLSFLIPLVVRVLKTTLELSIAISAKAYGAHKGRTFHRSRAMTGREWAVLAALPVLAALLIVWRATGHGAVLTGSL
jgi:energy-coupling factor transporter transmembrane protein EcfT